jgi:hypothetical protein
MREVAAFSHWTVFSLSFHSDAMMTTNWITKFLKLELNEIMWFHTMIIDNINLPIFYT